MAFAGGAAGALNTNRKAIFQHTTTGTTDGGGLTASTWNTRTINTTLENNIGASLASNKITLPAGKYDIEFSAVGDGVNSHMAKLYNVTDSSDVFFSTYGRAQITAIDNNIVLGKGSVTITAAKDFEIRHNCETTNAGAGQGKAAKDFSTNNIFLQITIYKG